MAQPGQKQTSGRIAGFSRDNRADNKVRSPNHELYEVRIGTNVRILFFDRSRQTILWNYSRELDKSVLIKIYFISDRQWNTRSS